MVNRDNLIGRHRKPFVDWYWALLNETDTDQGDVAETAGVNYTSLSGFVNGYERRVTKGVAEAVFLALITLHCIRSLAVLAEGLNLLKREYHLDLGKEIRQKLGDAVRALPENVRTDLQEELPSEEKLEQAAKLMQSNGESTARGVLSPCPYRVRTHIWDDGQIMTIMYPKYRAR